ncbi:WbqC family protein [Paenibacillus frigoriresistens]|uniref:WbqC family protein n=1 Tax=Paenibacillus alginolyticus TaxID=59839 RepID=UPI0015652AC7|nr:WbqC family protein [Paenibacillus frigoriresistens]NRF93668.1 WbqC family protein [Paenibacillus frigoriresistens]
MIVTAHQPAYLPWLGYFDKMIRSDVFVYLDTVQFEKNSFTNRNRIKTAQGPSWLTIPVNAKDHLSSSMVDLPIDFKQDWITKHLKSIYANYKKASRFELVYPKLEALYLQKNHNFADFCYHHLLFWVQELRINTQIIRSSELNINSKKSQLILDLCTILNANHYISGNLGKNYLQENDFLENNISIEYQDYKHPSYSQLWGEFLPYMSILDFWMNTDNIQLITGGNNNGMVPRVE